MEEVKINIDLDNELRLLETELAENEKFFTQVKDHYDKAMKSRGTATFKFITDQTGNVMNIRNNRIGIIKEMINIKKLRADMQIKELNIAKSGDENDTIIATAKELYNMMKSDNREGSMANILNKTNKLKDEAIEGVDTLAAINQEIVLDERMKAIHQKKIDERKEKEIKERGYLFACDIDGNVYAINKDGTEILENIVVPDFIIEFKVDALTNIRYAETQFGDILDIIEIDEEA